MAPAERPMTWWTDDWLTDIGVRSCSFAARGFWFDVLNYLHKSGKHTFAMRSVDAAQVLGGDATGIERLADELLTKRVANGKCVPGHVRLVSRRLLADFRERKLWRDKKLRQRGGNVPPLSPECPATCPPNVRKTPSSNVPSVPSSSVPVPLKKRKTERPSRVSLETKQAVKLQDLDKERHALYDWILSHLPDLDADAKQAVIDGLSACEVKSSRAAEELGAMLRRGEKSENRSAYVTTTIREIAKSHPTLSTEQGGGA